jgi:thiamine pyrophosphate-dependent acetolactate synthase large subunit-like protein
MSRQGQPIGETPAKPVFRDRDCVAVCGDDGFATTMSALLTAAPYHLPAVNVVLHNAVLGWVKDGQQRCHDRLIASELGRHDYARMAESTGCRGLRVETLDELGRAREAIPPAKEPTLLDIVITADAPFWEVQWPLAKEGPGGE